MVEVVNWIFILSGEENFILIVIVGVEGMVAWVSTNLVILVVDYGNVRVNNLVQKMYYLDFYEEIFMGIAIRVISCQICIVGVWVVD